MHNQQWRREAFDHRMLHMYTYLYASCRSGSGGQRLLISIYYICIYMYTLCRSGSGGERPFHLRIIHMYIHKYSSCTSGSGGERSSISRGEVFHLHILRRERPVITLDLYIHDRTSRSYTWSYRYTYFDTRCIHIKIYVSQDMGWLRLVGSLKF